MCGFGDFHGLKIDRNKLECDSDGKHPSCHTPGSTQQQHASSKSVDEDHVDKGHDEVGSSHHQTNGSGIAKTDHFEESGRVVHERVESRHLRNDHQSTGAEQRAPVGRVGVHLFDFIPTAFVLIVALCIFAGHDNGVVDKVNLAVCRLAIDLSQDSVGLVVATLVDQMAVGLDRKSVV